LTPVVPFLGGGGGLNYRRSSVTHCGGWGFTGILHSYCMVGIASKWDLFASSAFWRCAVAAGLWFQKVRLGSNGSSLGSSLGSRFQTTPNGLKKVGSYWSSAEPEL